MAAPLRNPPAAVSLLFLAILAGCSDSPTQPAADAVRITLAPASALPTPALIRQLAASRGITPLPRPAPVRKPLVRLGQALFFDRILSGNRDIACATCHLTRFGTGDGRSLSVGQGAEGAGPERTHPGQAFIPRNAPPLFNLGAMRQLFWDGRVEIDDAGRLLTPAGDRITPDMTRTVEFGAISALAMFPVTNRAEMRADAGNELAAIPDEDMAGIWAALMRRLGGIPEYRLLFHAAYPRTPFDDMTFAHAANAIGAFLVDQLTLARSPWDRFLAGNDRALSERQLRGAETFLTLRCSICHGGSTFSDDDFHNVAVAQIGPGQGDGIAGQDDFGRMRVTGDPADRYRFRTTPLRNVELTAPYGHDGAVISLRDFIAHYSESHDKLLAYDPTQLEPALRGTLVPNAAEILAQRDTLLDGVVFGDEILERLMDYMAALTDPAARDLSRLVPERVPSGLPVDRH